MARDYKYRANQNRKKPQQNKVVWWKWLLIILLVALFVFFLVFLRNSALEVRQDQQTKPIAVSKKTNKPKPEHQDKKPKEPQFDFYTILPETEVIVPDYEINTRSREERFRQAKATKYILQAGSFRNFSAADTLKARLALMGIESRVEKTKVGTVLWNRVKMGPYSRPSSVSVIKKRLRDNGIDVVVTEVKG